MDDLIFRKQAIEALEEWENIHTWDDWCRMHNDEKEEYNIIAPSDVLKKLPPASPSGAVITIDMLDYWSSVGKLQEKINEIINSAEPGWIPCSRELPKEDGQYIVTVKYEHVDGYEDIYSEHGEWVDSHWDVEFGHCGRVEKVLAWMPLPEPYRKDGEADG